MGGMPKMFEQRAADFLRCAALRVLHAIPSNEAIDTVEVLQSRSDPSFVSWKGGTDKNKATQFDELFCADAECHPKLNENVPRHPLLSTAARYCSALDDVAAPDSPLDNKLYPILAILDFSRDAWIHREDWIRNGIHIGSGRKYKDSYFLQAQTMCYINS